MRPPHHLYEWTGMIERAMRETVRGMCSVPVRHWKTETTNAGIVWCLIQDPTIPIVHMSHSVARATELGKSIRDLARSAGVGPERGNDTILQWKNEHGGGVTCMSADQSRIGGNVGLLVFDDPLDEHGSSSLEKRNEVDKAISLYTSRCFYAGRLGSVLGVMSRWNLDDVVARRLQRKAVNWEYISRPAIEVEPQPDGTILRRAFAPEVRTLEQLDAIRAELREEDPSERIWWSQWMSDPRPTGSDLFGPPHYYDSGKLPDRGYRLAYGADFSYTAGKGSDYCALIHGRVEGGTVYLIESQLHKLDARLIESTANKLVSAYGQAQIYSYQSGPELGLTRYLQTNGLPICTMPARYNKLVRATRTIAAWNAGKILLPRPAVAPWVDGFARRVQAFTGADDGADDEVDALVSLYDGYTGCAVGSLGSLGRRRC